MATTVQDCDPHSKRAITGFLLSLSLWETSRNCILCHEQTNSPFWTHSFGPTRQILLCYSGTPEIQSWLFVCCCPSILFDRRVLCKLLFLWWKPAAIVQIHFVKGFEGRKKKKQMVFVLFGEYAQFCVKKNKLAFFFWDSFEKKPDSDRLRTGAQSKALLSFYNYTEAMCIYRENLKKNCCLQCKERHFLFTVFRMMHLLLKLCTSFNLEGRKRVKGKTGGVLFWSFQCVKKNNVFFITTSCSATSNQMSQNEILASVFCIERSLLKTFGLQFLLYLNHISCCGTQDVFAFMVNQLKIQTVFCFHQKLYHYAPSSCCPHLSSIQHLYQCPLWLSYLPPPLPLPAPHQSLFRGAISKSAFPPASVFTFTPACRRPLEEAT